MMDDDGGKCKLPHNTNMFRLTKKLRIALLVRYATTFYISTQKRPNTEPQACERPIPVTGVRAQQGVPEALE